jgi:hypothetical protein
LPPQELREFLHLLPRDGDELTRFGVLLFCRPPDGYRVPSIDPPCLVAELLLGLAQLPQRNRQQTVGAQRDTLLEPQFPLEGVTTKAEGGFRPERQIRLEILDVSSDRLRRFG